MKCRMCPIALMALAAGGSLLALAQPDNSTTPHQSDNRPGNRRGNDPAHPGTNMQDSGNPDAMLKQMQELMAGMNQPGPNSKFLEKWIGRWDTTTKVFMAPGGPAQESRGHSEFSWMIEGRWLAEHVDGQMMGLPLKGFGLTGYDNYNKKFVGCWVDNMNTGMIVSSGSLDQTGNVLTMFGQLDEPTTGEHGKTVRYQTTVIDDDTHKLTADEVQYGKPFTVVEVTYKRVKP